MGALDSRVGGFTFLARGCVESLHKAPPKAAPDHDAGNRWRHGPLPAAHLCQTPSGFSQVADILAWPLMLALNRTVLSSTFFELTGQVDTGSDFREAGAPRGVAALFPQTPSRNGAYGVVDCSSLHQPPA